MGKRTLRLDLTGLQLSEGWRALEPGQQAEALRLLVISAIGGEVPARWAKLAALYDGSQRIGGDPPKPLNPRVAGPSVHDPFYRLWERVWEEERGEPFIWDERQKAGCRAAYKKAEGEMEAFEQRVRKRLCDQQNAWLLDNASPLLLADRWNQLGGGKPGRGKRIPVVEMCESCGARGVTLMRNEGKNVCLSCYG
jgi:hypothetical protein